MQGACGTGDALIGTRKAMSSYLDKAAVSILGLLPAVGSRGPGLCAVRSSSVLRHSRSAELPTEEECPISNTTDPDQRNQSAGHANSPRDGPTAQNKIILFGCGLDQWRLADGWHRRHPLRQGNGGAMFNRPPEHAADTARARDRQKRQLSCRQRIPLIELRHDDGGKLET